MARLRTTAPRLATVKSRLAAPTGEAERLAARNKARPNWYQSARWRALRKTILERDGFVCRQTGVLLSGRYPAATSAVIDHIRPHRWDARLFWDPDNLQSVSKAWHDSEKQRQERRGLVG